MTAGIAPLTARAAWKALQAHHQKIGDLHLRTLFADDPTRGDWGPPEVDQSVAPPGGWQNPTVTS